MRTDENPPIKILYEDSFLIICEKPVGLASQYTDSGDSLPERLLKYLGEDAYVGVVHRLDVGTGGVIIYAKNKDISQQLSNMISERKDNGFPRDAGKAHRGNRSLNSAL